MHNLILENKHYFQKKIAALYDSWDFWHLLNIWSSNAPDASAHTRSLARALTAGTHLKWMLINVQATFEASSPFFVADDVRLMSDFTHSRWIPKMTCPGLLVILKFPLNAINLNLIWSEIRKRLLHFIQMTALQRNWPAMRPLILIEYYISHCWSGASPAPSMLVQI